MSAPIILPRLDPAPLAELRQRYEEAPNEESRTRYQMLLLAQQGYKAPQIARIVLRSEDTVVRVFHRFLAAGLDAVPRCLGAPHRAESEGSQESGKPSYCASLN